MAEISGLRPNVKVQLIFREKVLVVGFNCKSAVHFRLFPTFPPNRPKLTALLHYKAGKYGKMPMLNCTFAFQLDFHPFNLINFFNKRHDSARFLKPNPLMEGLASVIVQLRIRADLLTPKRFGPSFSRFHQFS